MQAFTHWLPERDWHDPVAPPLQPESEVQTCGLFGWQVLLQTPPLHRGVRPPHLAAQAPQLFGSKLVSVQHPLHNSGATPVPTHGLKQAPLPQANPGQQTVPVQLWPSWAQLTAAAAVGTKTEAIAGVNAATAVARPA
jgi:hypothetical protein